MKRFRLFPILVLTTLALSILMPQAFDAQAAAPTITTDFPDYPPGALVTLTGTDWAPGEEVEIYVNDTANKTWEWRGTVTASPATETDPGGRFTASFYLPTWFVANYTVSATGPLSGTATTTFTDMSVGTYDQCSNDLGVGYPDGCRWINGNLQKNNSTYSEGDATVQRLWLTEFTPGTTHTVTLKYGTTKGGKHAYDYLTTWNWSENWLTLADRCEGITGCETAIEDTLAIPMDPNVPDSIEPASAGRLFTMRGADLISATTPAIVSGSYSGDSETVITITFTVGSGTGSMCAVKQGVTTCGVALWFGAHVALSADWMVYNGTTGAGSISGSPYHVALDQVDGASVGQRDNQMQSDVVIPNGSLVVIKDAIPNDPQDFNYKLTGGTATDIDFALDDDADPAFSNQINIPLPPGTFTLTEGLLPTGWTFTSLVCSDPSGNTTVSGQAATVNLASLETVTCTYTNTKSGKIIVRKVIEGVGAEADQAFTFDPSWSSDNFSLVGGGSHDSGPLLAGTYSVAESDPGPKWSLTSATCDDGSPVNAIDLANGETVTCTFTNTRLWNADLTVSKTAVPSFTRTYAWDIYKNVDATTASIALGGSATFNYTVGVTHDAGSDSAWALAGQITVSNPNAFPVAGVDITDAVPNGTCSVTDGTNLTVPANGSISRAYSCTFASAPAGSSNTATATWNAGTYNTPNGSASGSAAFDFGAVTPSIVNPSVNVTDTRGGTLGSVSYTAPSPTEFTYSQTFSGTGGKCVKYDNTATITENGEFATQEVEVCVGLDLTVSKTATPAFARTWSWTIDKSPDATYNLFAGGSVEHPYRVDVTPSYVDSGWAVAGTITVTNPNAWEAITADVTDAVNNGGTCTVTGGEDVSVPANGSVNLLYSCTYGALPADGTNTATATWDAAAAHTPTGSASGIAPVDFDQAVITETGKDITVHDDKLDGENWTASGLEATWEYGKTFSCPTDAALYTAGVYTYAETNIASIDGTALQDSSTVTVNCYLLAVAKTAAGSYVEEHGWEVAKSVTPALQSAFLGDTVSYEWTVTATETVTEQSFAVTGQITVNNPSPAPITVALSDVLSDGTAATIIPGDTCAYADGQLTVPAASTAICSYSAAPAGRTATKNTVTAVFGGRTVTAEATVAWTPTVLHASVSLDDDQNPGLPGTISESGSWTYSESHTCSTTQTDYGATSHQYIFGENNTAVIKDGETTLDYDTASVAVNCYTPVVSKTAAGTYDERHEWDVEKTVNVSAQSGFAGDTLPFTWTIQVTESVFEESFAVTGAITVVNPAPMPMTVALSDALDDGTQVIPTACTGEGVELVNGNLTVPAGITAKCVYTVAPTGHTAISNTATITLGSVSLNASDPIEWTTNVIRGEAQLTDLQGPLNETITGSGSWTVEDSYTCSTDKAQYISNYSYSETILNTAVVTSEEEQQDSSTVSTAITCVIPEISKTAAGTYTERHEWDVEKTVSPVSQSAFLGDTVSYEWTVTVKEDVIEENFVAAGTITLVNHNAEDAMTVTLSDVLNDTPATITACTGDADLTNGLTIAAGATSVCNYTAALTYDDVDLAPTSNTATALLNGVSYSASDPIDWVPTVIRGSAALDDDQNPNLPPTISDGGTWKYSENYTCSTDKAGYDATTHKYTFGESNTALVKDGETTLDSSTASNTINCYVPTISKDANGRYDEVHDWMVYKSAAPSQKKFAGQSAGYDWTVRVDETTHGENYLVTGNITVVNPNPEDAMTVSLSDVLNDGSPATIGSCTGGTLVDSSLTVPAGGTATCGYTVTPKGDMGAFNAALPASVTMSVQYPYTGGPAYFPVTTISGGGALNGTYEGWCVDTEHTINQNTNYTANVFSSYESLPAGLVGHPENFDLVNWIINQDFVGKPSTGGLGLYTYSDVQYAIWSLIETETSTSGLYDLNYNRAAQIIAAANASGEGFMPSCGDFVAVVLQPVGGSSQTITIAQVTFASLGVDCATSNVVTAVLNKVEFTANAQISWAANPVNPTATLDDTQNPAWPATVNADGTFTYTDPDGYTCPTDPAAYTGDGIAPVYTDSNIATITYTGGSKSAMASTSITCYAPVMSKDASTEWHKKYDWTIAKTANPTSHIGFAGDSFTSNYDVFVDQTITDHGFLVTGTINIANPNGSPGNMTVDVADVISGDIPATVDCDPATTGNQATVVVATNTTKTCAYTADLPDNTSRVNTATGTFNSIGFPATANVVFGAPVIEGYPTINVTDSVQGTLGLASGDQHFTYSRNFSCSANPADYTGYANSDTYGNIATITETSAAANASVKVDCYIPEISKTAAGAYTERHEWNVEKTVTPASQNIFAGGTASYEWKVVVTETVYEEGFIASGTITIVNHNPEDAMTVALSDVLSDNTAATITACTGDADLTNGLTIAASATSVCNYTAALIYDDVDLAPTSNSATAVLNNLSYSASDPIEWTANVIRGSAVVTDDQIGLNRTITDGGTFTGSEQYVCSTNQLEYGGVGTYIQTESNTAIVTSGGAVQDRDDATETIHCYAPVVTKTASTYWNRDWDWSIVKDYNGSYNLFAGDTVTHGYKVSVTPTYTDNFWGVKGNITVYNYHPTEAMTLTSLTDLAGGINGGVTCPSLVVPAAGSLTCTYDTGAQTAPNANPFGDTNTATAVFAATNWTGTAPIAFSTTPTTENEPVITVDDDNLTGESWSANRAAGEWTYTKDFACSSDPAKYTNGKYFYSLTNTATITETGQTDTARVDVNCYWPQIELTKTGDGLSKIGDGVTYTIKLDNNTPAAANLRSLACTISDATIGFSKTVTLASGASDTSTKAFIIPTGASDPFLNTASVACKPVAATAPVVGNSTFSVSDSSTWETNLFQPAVEILKTGPLYATSGDVITYSFTINNKSSSDSPNLMLDSVSDNVLGDLKAAALAAGCDNLVYNGSCTFTAAYTVPDVGLQALKKTNVVTLHYHPAGFPNDITDSDDHTVTITPRGQLTDTSFCPLANNQFRLLYRLYAAPNTYLLNGSNPGQFYYNAFYFGEPGSTFTMDIEIPYPFMTQEGAGNPIQVHDGTGITSSGCFAPTPSLSGFTIATEAMTPASSAGNQIITPEDYTTKQIGQTTTVTVSGTVPATGFAYVTIHLDYGLKKTQPWKPTGTFTTNPVTGALIGDMIYNNTGPTILGVQPYTFSRTAGGNTATSSPASYNEIKKFAGFLGFVSDLSEEAPVPNTKVEIYDPKGVKLTTLYTDEDGYYMFLYKHTAKAATYTIKLPNYGRTVSVTVKANGFAAVDFDLP